MNMTSEDLRTLLETRDGWCISLYMPTHRAGPEIQQDQIRLKNLLSKAEQQLIEKGLRSPDARKFLEPVSRLLEDHVFWRHQENGLAAFMAKDWHQVYRLPLSFSELIMVESRFYLKPLLPRFMYSGQFHLLALSQNHIRLFTGSKDNLTEVPTEHIPHSLEEALQPETVEQALQWHTGTTSANTGPGEVRPGMFHGQGGGEDEAKERIKQFFHQVNKGIHASLRDEQAPLYLAGVEYLLPLYKETNTYPHVMEDGITGNPDGKSPQELHKQIWPVAQKHQEQDLKKAVSRFGELNGTGKASSDLQEVVLASGQGRVDTLFVAQDIQRWGRIDVTQNKLELEEEKTPETQEILDFAAVQTLLNKGKVYALPQDHMPGKNSLAAIFRY